MNSFALVFAVLLAGAHAQPTLSGLDIEAALRSGQQRALTDSITSAIESVSQAIIDAGIDPFIIEEAGFDYALSIPTIFNVRAYVEGLLFQGASNIVINDVDLSVLALRVTLNVEIPQILLNIVDSEIDANLLDKNFNGRFNGRLAINNIVATGNVRVRLGLFSGVSLREIALTIGLGSIDSQLNLSVQNVDLSNSVNAALGETLPAIIDAYADDINELLTGIGKEIIEAQL